MRPTFAFVLLLLGLAAFPAAAQTNLPGGVLTEEERAVIRDYFGQKLGQVLGRRQNAERADDQKRDADTDTDTDTDGPKSAKGSGKPAWAGKGKGKGNNKKHGKGRGKGLPPGLAKRSSLPPGLQRHLDERGALPKGLRTKDLPDDLEQKLPPIKDDFKRVILDDSVVLIEKGTNRVLDILEGVLTGPSKR